MNTLVHSCQESVLFGFLSCTKTQKGLDAASDCNAEEGFGGFFDEERPLQRAQGGAIEAVKAARGGRVGDGGVWWWGARLAGGLSEQLCGTAGQFSLVLEPGHKSFYFPQARAPVLYTAHHLIKGSKVTALVKVILPLPSRSSV